MTEFSSELLPGPSGPGNLVCGVCRPFRSYGLTADVDQTHTRTHRCGVNYMGGEAK